MPTAIRTNPLSFLTDQLDELKAKGTHFKLRVLDDEQAPVCTFDGKRVINLASNNYLGLTTHPKLREAALEATRKYGVGSGAVRTIAGTMKIHMDLEEKIARFKNVEACVVFQSGFTANAGTVSSFLGKDDFIISDELNHASIIDGARLSRAKILVFRHKDVAHAEEQLASVKNQPGKKLVITDGVFSMDGDISPLPGLCEAAEKYGAIMMVDDAHSSGVLGRQGRGTIDHFKVHGRVDIQVGTLSKAIGSLGGYVCGTRDLIDFLYHRARPFLFSTSHPPSVAATCIAAFDVLETEPERIEKLWENARLWKRELGLLGFNIGGKTTPASETPITPIIVGDGKLTMDFSRELFKEGVMGTGIAFPTVPEGKARIRTIVTATHTEDELQQALEVLRRVGKRRGMVWGGASPLVRRHSSLSIICDCSTSEDARAYIPRYPTRPRTIVATTFPVSCAPPNGVFCDRECDFVASNVQRFCGSKIVTSAWLPRISVPRPLRLNTRAGPEVKSSTILPSGILCPR